MVVLDTNVIIDHLRLPKGSETILIKIIRLNPRDIIAISIISVQELYQGRSSRDPMKENDIRMILDNVKILPYGVKVAKLAGEIIRDLSRPIGFSDAAIAATAIVNGFYLFTLNKKDFADIKNLQLAG